MPNIQTEFKRLRKRYNLKYLKLYFDPFALDRLKSEAILNFILWEICLRDKRICRRRLLSLLHEMRHAMQFKQNRMTMNGRHTKILYSLEIEAEMFAVEEYEKLYAKKYGSCLNDKWTLATYEDYCEHFKKHWKTLGFGRILVPVDMP